MWREYDFVLILFNLYLQNKSNQPFLLAMSFFLDKLLATGGYDGSIPLFLASTPQAIWSSLHPEETKKKVSLFCFFKLFILYWDIAD